MQPGLHTAFEVLGRCPPWLGAQLSELNRRYSPSDVRGLAFFSDDPFLPPLSAWPFLSSRSHRARCAVLRDEVKSRLGTPHHDVDDIDVEELASREAAGAVISHHTTPVQALIVMEPLSHDNVSFLYGHALGSERAGLERHIRKGTFLHEVGHVIEGPIEGQTGRVAEKAADLFAINTLLQQADRDAADVFTAYRAVSNFISFCPRYFNVLALRKTMGDTVPEGDLDESEPHAMSELAIWINCPHAHKWSAAQRESEIEHHCKMNTLDGGYQAFPGPRELSRQLDRLQDLRDRSLSSPAAHFMANEILEGASLFGIGQGTKPDTSHSRRSGAPVPAYPRLKHEDFFGKTGAHFC